MKKMKQADLSVGAQNWVTDNAPLFAVRQIRDDLAAMPEAKRTERLDRVRELLAKESRQNRLAHSALWRLAQSAYGINPNTCI